MASNSDQQADAPSTSGEEADDELPVHRQVDAGLVDFPRKRIEATIERTADVYFGLCRRIAEFLNRGDDR